MDNYVQIIRKSVCICPLVINLEFKEKFTNPNCPLSKCLVASIIHLPNHMLPIVEYPNYNTYKMSPIVGLHRQLPMLAGALQGQAIGSFAEIKHKNQLFLFTHVLGILELLQPYLFHAHYEKPFSDVLQCFFHLIRVSVYFNYFSGSRMFPMVWMGDLFLAVCF